MASKFRFTENSLRGEPDGPPASILMAERIASFYDRQLPYFARGTLVDLGAGERPLRALYETLVERSWAFDWPGSVHDVAIDGYADLNSGIPLRSGSVDTVLISDVLEHLAEAPEFLNECYRVLRCGGVIIGNVPFIYWLHEEPHDYYRFTEYGLRHLLGRAGFTSIDVVNLGGGFDVVVDMAGKVLAQVPLAGYALARAAQIAWARRPTRVDKQSPTRARLKYPLAYGFVAERPGS